MSLLTSAKMPSLKDKINAPVVEEVVEEVKIKKPKKAKK